MRNNKRKIIYALLVMFFFLVVFIGFSKFGILFSENSKDIVTVSTANKTFDANNYVASVAALSKNNGSEETTTVATENTTTTTSKTVKTTTVPTTTVQPNPTPIASNWDGPVLSKSKGVVTGPSGKETYYNLDMTKIVNAMRRAGYSESEYPYWVREDGVKMLGGYVMVAANYEIRPKGTILPSSLGSAIVCDTGGFAKTNPTQIDVAVTWR